MATYKCSSCGRQIQPAPQCPHCGALQGQWADELAKIERSIAEIKADDIRIAKEAKLNAQKLQAAQFQRDILAHANAKSQDKVRQSTRTRRRTFVRRPPNAAPGAGGPPPPPPRRVPRQDGARPTATAPPPPLPPEDVQPEHRPEASTREVQNIYLGLGGLLLGIAAVVFAAVAFTSFDDISRAAILIGATVLMLVASPVVARKGLISTAETIAAVGLGLVPLDGYALWTVDQIRSDNVPGAVVAGIVFALTALIAGWYAALTGLSVPRYATVLALQPVLPLLAYEWISGPAGWALVLTVVAAQDLLLARQFDQRGRLATPPWLGSPVTAPPEPATDRPEPAEPGDGESRKTPPSAERPESAPEESDAVVTDADAARNLPPAPAAAWLRQLTWGLSALAVAAAVLFAAVATLRADTPPGALAAGLTLVLAAAVGVAGATPLGQRVVDAAAAVLTLAVIGAASQLVAVAMPGRALLLIAAVIALTGLGVRAVPESIRRGPQLASAVALIVMGVVVAGTAIRAAVAPVRAAFPVWEADLSAYHDRLAEAAGPAGWQLAATALLLTVAAALSLPPQARRESAVAGVALTALAAPASFALPWSAAPWLPVLAAIGIGATGLYASTERAARAHVAAAAVVGLVGAGASLARPSSTAAVLAVLTLAGVLIAIAGSWLPEQADALRDEPAPAQFLRAGPAAEMVGEWASGGAAFAMPGAAAAAVAATAPVREEAAVPILAAAFVAVCATLGYAALAQVAWRRIALPLTVGTGLGALAVTAAAFGAPGAEVADAWVGALLLVGAVLLFLAPSIDAGRRPDRLLDGTDFAAAAAIAGIVGTFARISGILFPGAVLAVAALLVLFVAVGVRAMPAEWRRGPVLGVAASGAVIAVIAGYTALSGGLRVLATPGALWEADLGAWPSGPGGVGWQAPVALVLLAGAAAIVLPRPWAYDVAAVCVGLATIGAPVALGLPWWSPMLVGGAVATIYGIAATMADDPRAGLARATVAAGVALHAVGASLVRPWTTAVALAMVVLVGALVATLARMLPALDDADLEQIPGSAPPPEAEMPLHLGQIGGAAAGGALLALPGALASTVAALGYGASAVLAWALVGSFAGLAVIAVARRRIARYLPYATVGVAGGATITAFAALPTGLPIGVYAAAAVLLGVVAELLRSATPPPRYVGQPTQRWSVMLGGVWRRMPSGLAPRGQWSVSPEMGAVLAAALPTLLAFAAIAPALVAALVDPHQTLNHIWDGPPAALTAPDRSVDPSDVLGTLLLTIAAALAAIGFGGRRFAQAIPVILPGAAVTLLITPIAFGAEWPASTMAALAVYTLAMLGLALTPPPPPAERARALRVTRVVVFALGLAAGGAGLAGSLASESLTLVTLGGSAVVGAIAAIFGQSQRARILGWLIAAASAMSFVLTAALIAGLPAAWSAYGVLAVGAALLVVAALMPRLRRPEAFREAATVEWSGYGAALVALALAFDSLGHVAGLLAAWGAVLGIAAARPGRRPLERRTLFWASILCEIVAWWLFMALTDVSVPEAYTLPFAALALLVGLIELRQRPDLSSWTAYGPALIAAFVPTLVIAIRTDASPTREVLLLLGAVATVIFGARTRQQAPLVIGTVVTVISALHALTLVGLSWLILIPIGALLIFFGATNESRRRTQERWRAVTRMR
ncbi:SCO7613 C-terminal domain-containing membrane protein [Phytohabitans kaempferiae]|uniref:SCO7613 C-terminal domain-containing membrane protein n=1 Tax=Phytohabitans kaempferiae TaxID=1620943 RepID=A0ABV6LZX6_9ACTN